MLSLGWPRCAVFYLYDRVREKIERTPRFRIQECWKGSEEEKDEEDQDEQGVSLVIDEDGEPEQTDSQPGHSEPVTAEPSSRPRLSDSSDSFSEFSEFTEGDTDSVYSGDESSVDSDHVGTYMISNMSTSIS